MCSVSKPSSALTHAGASASVHAIAVQIVWAPVRIANTTTASTAYAIEAAAGRRVVLLARSAGVHVDFHADRHFHDLRSFPSHSGSPNGLSATSRRAKPRAASSTAQVWNRTADTTMQRNTHVLFPLGQIAFA